MYTNKGLAVNRNHNIFLLFFHNQKTFNHEKKEITIVKTQ